MKGHYKIILIGDYMLIKYDAFWEKNNVCILSELKSGIAFPAIETELKF